jgi:hypothetical protein
MRPVLVLAAVAMAACGTIAAPAGLAAADESAIQTIGLLEAQGYTVNVDRVGSAPLSECIVTNVRNPQTVTKLVRVERGGKHDKGDDDFDWVEVVVSQSISVSLDCSR